MMHPRIGIPLLAMVMTACNGAPPPTPRAATAPEAPAAADPVPAPAVPASAAKSAIAASELTGTHWHLVGTSAGDLARHGAATGITLEFGADQVTGFGGCNRYSASFAVAGGVLSVGAVAATKRGCPGNGDAIERAWHATLATPLTLAREGRELRARTTAGEVLSFAPGPAPGAER